MLQWCGVGAVWATSKMIFLCRCRDIQNERAESKYEVTVCRAAFRKEASFVQTSLFDGHINVLGSLRSQAPFGPSHTHA